MAFAHVSGAILLCKTSHNSTKNGERGINHYLCGNPPLSLEKYAEIMEKYGLMGE